MSMATLSYTLSLLISSTLAHLQQYPYCQVRRTCHKREVSKGQQPREVTQAKVLRGVTYTCYPVHFQNSGVWASDLGFMLISWRARSWSDPREVSLHHQHLTLFQRCWEPPFYKARSEQHKPRVTPEKPSMVCFPVVLLLSYIFGASGSTKPSQQFTMAAHIYVV